MKRKIFHIRFQLKDSLSTARAFAQPENILEKIIFFCKGWRYFNQYWWSKPSKNLKLLLKEQKIFW